MKPVKPLGLLLAVGLLYAVARIASAVSVPGLYGGSKTGTFLTTTWPAVTNIYLRPYPLSTAAQNTYYIYWGKIRLLAGVNSFGLAIDDNEYLKRGRMAAASCRFSARPPPATGAARSTS